MRKFRTGILMTSLFLLAGVFTLCMGQQERSGLSITRNYFPDFQLQEDHFPGSTAYTLQLSHYDPDYTRLEYRGHYTRGYHRSVSYSYGFSAAYVLPFTDDFFLKAGVGLDSYKMRGRECKSLIRGILKTFFDAEDDCDDDLHTSLSPFLGMEIMLTETISVVMQTSYRATLSNTRYIKETITETGPDGEEYVTEITGRRNAVYGTGMNIGIGVKLNF